MDVKDALKQPFASQPQLGYWLTITACTACDVWTACAGEMVVWVHGEDH